jgi:GntR family transcriptional regulator
VLNQLLDLRFVEPDAPVAQRLALPAGGKVAEIRRLRLLDREPVSLEITYVPEALGRKLAQADLATRDIFLIIENEGGLPLGHADLQIDATLADAELAAALRTAEGAPVLRIERLTHDAQGRPIDFEYLYFRAETFQYRLRVDRHRRQER